jgi:hypothetical protein
MKFLKDLLYENGEASLTRCLAIAAWVIPWTAFLVVTIYLLIHKIEWGGYGTFSIATTGSGVAGTLTQLVNKVSNCVNNSPSGVPYVKNNN